MDRRVISKDAMKLMDELAPTKRRVVVQQDLLGGQVERLGVEGIVCVPPVLHSTNGQCAQGRYILATNLERGARDGGDDWISYKTKH